MSPTIHTQAGELASLELRLIGQIGSRIIEELDHLAEVNHRVGDVLVLAELMIGGAQVGKVDAVKGLDVGTDRLRVVQRSGDKLIEVDGLERPTHMGAAIAKSLHYFGLILERIEVRLDRLRLRRDLAQRQRGGKNLDEDRVHATTPRSKSPLTRSRFGGHWTYVKSNQAYTSK
jgi:hypothetical protein